MTKTIAHYEITGVLGEGGMGIVYSARDARLNRVVALKMIRRSTADPAAAERLRREARAAATVNHPNICQLYDLGEESGDLYIAMELLQGESLAARIARGPIPIRDTVEIGLETLSALQALHDAGLIHRDLKPSNIFLTQHGVKLLDFGLARGMDVEEFETRLTMPGTVIGTPHYLAPEQIQGQPLDPRTDLFAVGSVLYEMLTGRHTFEAASLPGVLHAIAFEQPPALGGSPSVAAVDRMIHKAIAKRPADRYPSAQAMADDLRAARTLTDSTGVSPVRPMTRLIVLPFRVLRPDPEIDFLSFSLSDALTTSLSGLDSLVVRSSLSASRFAGENFDLQEIAAKADVDAVLTGTLLRADNQLRVTAQLADTPHGTVRWSQTTQVTFGDIFQLQDSLTKRIVESLAIPLTARDERTLKRGVPANPRAYEFYLRANQIAYEAKNWTVARDLYRQCLDEDPNYAPAWARLGRIYRVIAMYSEEGSAENYARAEEAFRRALELDPDLSIAHNLFTAVELETGRARHAMLRLLERVRLQSADPELFAGLVQACRYAGLDGPAIAAHEHARRLEPQIRTAVAHAYFTSEDYQRAIETDQEDPPFLTVLALDLLGRRDEALASIDRQITAAGLPPLLRDLFNAMKCVMEGRRDEATTLADAIVRTWRLRDPCATFHLARVLAAVKHPEAERIFTGAVEGGFHAPGFFRRDPWLDPLRGRPQFDEALRFADEQSQAAAAAFVAAGGERLLGPLNS